MERRNIGVRGGRGLDRACIRIFGTRKRQSSLRRVSRAGKIDVTVTIGILQSRHTGAGNLIAVCLIGSIRITNRTHSTLSSIQRGRFDLRSIRTGNSEFIPRLTVGLRSFCPAYIVNFNRHRDKRVITIC